MKTIKKASTLLTPMLVALAVAGSACNRQDTGARNVSVPERSESTTADIERREEGMTGATNTTDANDASSMHSDRREAARTGEKNKGQSTESGTTGTTNSK